MFESYSLCCCCSCRLFHMQWNPRRLFNFNRSCSTTRSDLPLALHPTTMFTAKRKSTTFGLSSSKSWWIFFVYVGEYFATLSFLCDVWQCQQVGAWEGKLAQRFSKNFVLSRSLDVQVRLLPARWYLRILFPARAAGETISCWRTDASTIPHHRQCSCDENVHGTIQQVEGLDGMLLHHQRQWQPHCVHLHSRV